MEYVIKFELDNCLYGPFDTWQEAYDYALAGAETDEDWEILSLVDRR